MANKRIAEFTVQSSLNATDEFLLQETDDGDYKKVLLSVLKTYIDTDTDTNIPAGTIIPYANNSTPTGYLLCDGSAVSRTTYATLFTAISTTWGAGDTTTTFNLPDLEGAFLRGTGTHGTNKMADNNYYAGPAVGAYENDQMQGHYHSALSPATTVAEIFGNNSHGGSLVGNGGSGVGYALSTASTGETLTNGTHGTTRPGDETRAFAAGVKFIIKY